MYMKSHMYLGGLAMSVTIFTEIDYYLYPPPPPPPPHLYSFECRSTT